jgi:hypothetical protein
MMFLEKLSSVFAFLKPSRKERHRTLMLVGSHGEAVSIKRFQGVTVLTTLLFIVTIIVIVYLSFASGGLKRENEELKETLSDYQLKIKQLKNENDILMARLVAGSEGEVEVFESEKTPVKTPSDAEPSDEPLGQLNIEEEIKKAGQQLEKNRLIEKTVAVENLIVTHESNTKTLRVRFDLRNIDPNLNPVSGRTVVVLKTSDQSYNNWLTLPFVPLVSGKPASTTTGRTFLISRFKTVKFSIAGQTNPNRYTTATVFVFSKAGERLLEKDFKVEVKKILASTQPDIS